MSRRRRSLPLSPRVRLAAVLVGSLAVVVVVVVVIALRPSDGTRTANAVLPPVQIVDPPAQLVRRASVVTVGGASATPPVPAGFIGWSIEYDALTPYTGLNPSAVDPVLLQLIRNLTPGQAPVLRIGGDSSDHTWVPIPGRRRPPGATNSLRPRWLAAAGALARDLNARMIMGINLEANSAAVAATEARALIGALGAARVRAFEIGNEPELYSSVAWRKVNGHGVTGRPASYDVAGYNQDFARFARALPPAPLAGPATGGQEWMSDLPQFLAAAPRLAVVTVHRYPLIRCFSVPGQPMYPSIGNLLNVNSSIGLAASVAGAVSTSRAHGVSLRVDELNSVACTGKHGVSDTFASALWMLDTLFAMAQVGVTGVNIHTLPGAVYHPFSLRHGARGWTGRVWPEYYGLMMFARAAPPGSRLLNVSRSAGGQLRPWATRGGDGRIRIVVINESARRSRVLALRVPAASGLAYLQSLRAPRLGATAGVTLGGESFGAATTTGSLPPISITQAVAPAHGKYVINVPAASAMMLTLAPRH